jgi:hypothetical protein
MSHQSWKVFAGNAPSVVTFASEDFVGRLLLIDALSAVALLAAWYFLFSRYNRKKAANAMKWVETACSGNGRIIEARWLGSCRLQAQLRFVAHWFDNARVTVRLRPRPIPLQWLFSIWRKQKETLTFEADLGYAPSFQLEVFRHQWVTHKHTGLHKTRKWAVTRPGPVILTTRTQWTQELTPVVNTLMTSRGHSLVAVRFRPDSPHLAATVDLETLADEQAAAGFLLMLRDLAAGASASKQ